ncbi:hypothetical protein TELCIR_25692 [Teladorsagia circumcincta]|uniref:Uncharacterized protein n=1 Tax=Teladorsagia circumcincta TaxID=45464 RepID=A0A2G9T4V2_TELCI|nr:hypothetical protein TELCIR_25692 [Teladorsagia circumcincta]
MVLFANIGIFFGVHLLGTFVSFAVGKFGAALLAFIALPVYAHHTIKKAVCKNAQGDRKVLLGGTIGTAVGVNFTLGLITGSLSFTYLLLTLVYAGIAHVIMQLCLKNLKCMDKGHLYQNALSCAVIAAKGMFFLTFGSYYPDDQDQQKQSDK